MTNKNDSTDAHAAPAPSDPMVKVDNFANYKLSDELRSAIREMGYEQPSPIQAATWPILLPQDGQKQPDFIGLAATGTGKTAAFVVPLLEALQKADKGPQALILCPTRELCLQVTDQVNLLGRHKRVKALAVYGGTGYEEQLRGLKMGASVVVGTPGRVMDHLRRGKLRLEGLRVVVLDEADEMISMGFREAIETVLETVPRDSAAFWMFSATMDQSVRRVADRFLRQPKSIQVNRTETIPASVEQYFYRVLEKNKVDVLCKLIEAGDPFYGVVFCQTKQNVVDVQRKLVERGMKVDCLHGDMDQNARERTLAAFKQKRSSVLVCTDVAARGLDVKDLTHVINYSLPRELENYVHRIGRTARSGKAGLAMSLVTPSHSYLIGKIEQLTKRPMREGQIPSRKTLALQRLEKFRQQLEAKKVGEKVNEKAAIERVLEVMSPEWTETLAGLSPREVAASFMSVMFGDLFLNREPEFERPARQTEGGHRSERDARGGDREPRRHGYGGGGGGGRDGRRPPRAFRGRPRPAGRSGPSRNASARDTARS